MCYNLTGFPIKIINFMLLKKVYNEIDGMILEITKIFLMFAVILIFKLRIFFVLSMIDF